MKFTLKNAYKFGWKGLEGKAYNSKDDFKNASVAFFKVNGEHGKIKTTLSDRVYYVTEGSGEFIINGKTIMVRKTDVIIVPKNTPYNYKGKMKLLLVHIPAYNERYEVKLLKDDWKTLSKLVKERNKKYGKLSEKEINKEVNAHRSRY
ncbi:MAG: hypothetical protein ABR981_03220 [Candidatus Micrarchaeaceae archaeon]|jgi:mannose-6-phosphate isomerase-like protein (cupin superfamily)